MKPVSDKHDFYKRFYTGEFGNHGPMWSTYTEWFYSQYQGLVAIRTLKPGGPCVYNIEPRQLSHERVKLELQGWCEFNYSAMAPTNRIILQGELSLMIGGLYLYWSRVREPMRVALATNSEHCSGVIANGLLRGACDLDSYDWLMELLEQYVDHVIEFSVFECCWGVIENRNTVIWEVRRY